ncbi:lipoyltransferase and lipoate-protein ligase [Pediococcus acidilactici D3]|nr:lipoyltransferase and lipoate-protein ligase [Pediococcus acidilactici D3]
MNELTTEIIAALAQKQDLDEVFRHHLEIAINQLLQTELAEFLGYERYSYAGINAGNNRNGSYERSFDTKYGQLNLTIPRDRNGRFEKHTLPAYGRHSDNLETTVIQLYTKGITTAEITELIEKMYGAHYSKATVSNMTKAVNEQVQAFQQRRLASQYAAIFLDATYLPLKRDTVQKEAVHIAIGIRPDGTKEVLNYQVAPTESTGIWTELLGTLIKQGVKDVLLFVADGLVGLDEGLNRHFPKAKRQRCLVHVGRNLVNKVRVKDRKAVISDLKQVHRAAAFPMNELTTEIIAALAQKQDLDEVFRHHLEIAINQLLQTELAEFLGYERYSYAGINAGNNRNGSYERSFDTKYGQLNLTIPRDRNGRFEKHTLPAYGRHSDNLETTVIQLYTKGITTAEITELIEKMYGAHYSKATVSNMTKAVNEQVQAFQQRRLASQYAAIFLDATYLPLKRDTVQKEAVHIAIGIRPDGTKEVLNYQVAPTESTGIWTELLGTLIKQGIKDVLLFVAYGLVGLDEGLNRHFPKAKRQRCLVHVGRNLMNKVRKRPQGRDQ